MFIVDDLLKECISYLFKRVEKSRDAHDTAIESIRVAMRGLSASFGEIIELLKLAEHKMKRKVVAKDKNGFWSVLRSIVDDKNLRKYCNESGVCQNLRIAQDKLYNLTIAESSSMKNKMDAFASQLEAYEIHFIKALKEYLSRAEKVDLVVVANKRDVPVKAVLASMHKSIRGLEKTKENIDNVLSLIREKSVESWI